MNIIQVIPSLSKAGGAERFVVDLSIALKESGHNVLILVLYKDTINFFQTEIDKHKIRIIYLNKKKGLDLYNSLALRKAILAFSPNVVNTHINSQVSMKLTGLWTRKHGISYFHTMHSIPEKECKKPFIYHFMKKLYTRKIVEPIAISGTLSRDAKLYFKLKYVPTTIYNGVYIRSFSAINPILDREYDFISVARFQSLKNQIMLAKATIFLHNLGYKLKTVFIGEGPELNNVVNFVRLSGASEYIFFQGQVKNVNEYLSNSKCFVIPSFYEGNPISVLEAMASGLMVIGTNKGGIKDIIEEKVNGYLVNPTDLSDLIDKMKIVLDFPDTLINASKNNLIKVKQYDMSNVAKLYLRAYGKTNIQ